jgi:hypothetical protein
MVANLLYNYIRTIMYGEGMYGRYEPLLASDFLTMQPFVSLGVLGQELYVSDI